MSVEQRTGFLGLVTNASSQQTPAGALIEANNVVVRRSGAVEPRDGLLPATGMDGTELWGFSYGVEDIIARGPALSPDLFTEWRTIAGTVLANGPQPLREDIFTKAELRGNLYVAARDGVSRLFLDSAEFKRAGLPLETAITGAGPIAGATWFTSTYSVAYRVVGYREDASGLILRSIPSGAFVATNPGADSAAFVNILSQGINYTQIELYRSRVFPPGVQVDDEMQLVGRFDVPPGPPAVFQIIDTIAQDDRGATLYTSPSRGGLLQQNEPPPACACVAAFKSSLFFGNTRGPHRITLNYDWTSPLAGQADGIGARRYDGDLQADQETILLADTTGLQVGMVVMHPFGSDGTNIVVSVNPGVDVVVAPPFPSSGPSGIGPGVNPFTFYDSITITGPGGSFTSIAPSVGDTPINLFWFAPAAGYVAYFVTPPTGGFDLTLVIESVSRDGGSYTITATHGNEYQPPLPLTGDPPMDMPQDVFPGGLWWSKPDEPEHVAPINFAFVGDQKRAILGLVPTRDALFILKEDGVWRLTGVNATWRIDPYDPTLFCCLPNSIVPLQERAYFLSNKGVIAFSDGGSELISQPIDDLIHPLIDDVYQWFRDTGLYQIPHLQGFLAGVYERENEYTMLSREFEPAFVYNRNTSAWTRFHWGLADGTTTPDEESRITAAFTLPYQGRVVYAIDVEELGEEFLTSVWTRLHTDAMPTAFAMLPRYDWGRAAALSNVGGGQFALDVPAFRDDVFVDGAGRFWRVTQNSPAGVGFSLDTPDAPAPGPVTLYRPLHCRVTPQVFATPPPRPKRWRAFSATFERFDGADALRYAYASSESPRDPSTQWDEEDVDAPVEIAGLMSYPMGLAYAGLVPNAHARAWSMRASVRWVMPEGYARLEGCFVEAEVGEIGRQQRAY